LFNIYLNRKNEFTGKREELEKFLISHKINPDFSEVQERIKEYIENYTK
jgi:translation initiation factor 2 beta subunit (eIF-2beta)/eIF-5